MKIYYESMYDYIKSMIFNFLSGIFFGITICFLIFYNKTGINDVLILSLISAIISYITFDQIEETKKDKK